jgi:hypothetical protein
MLTEKGRNRRPQIPQLLKLLRTRALPANNQAPCLSLGQRKLGSNPRGRTLAVRQFFRRKLSVRHLHPLLLLHPFINTAPTWKPVLPSQRNLRQLCPQSPSPIRRCSPRTWESLTFPLTRCPNSLRRTVLTLAGRAPLNGTLIMRL